MKTEQTTLRIFISSPGDVSEEREQAERVIRELDARFGAEVELEVILWEHLGIGADASFQEGINRLLDEGGGIDVAVFILWSRIGSEVGGKLKREDGTRWQSGTQAEFYLMLEARDQSGQDPKRPEILAYVREDDDGFRQRVLSQASDEMERLLNQKKALEQFVRTEFNDEKGRNLRAYHSYPEPVTFANQLEIHLRAIIERLLGDRVIASRWSSDPYRGLNSFDIEHAEIFCGREQQILELENRFRERHRKFLKVPQGSGERNQETRAMPFVVILGSSGSGKSSLARAGLAAKLLHRNRDPNVRQWRVATFIPTEVAGGLLPSLSATLREAKYGISELNAESASVLANHLVDSPAELSEAGLDLAEKEVGGPVQLLVIVDQFEELFSGGISEPERKHFLEELKALAMTGRVWVLATLRSDFYATAQKDELFRELKGQEGGFDLVAPSLGDLRRIIEEPARLVGLRFEQDDESGRSLADVILEEAREGESMGLPLIQDALQELYQQRSGDGEVTFQIYREMGGIRGCLQRRTQHMVESLDPKEKESLPDLFRNLVTIETETERVVRQRFLKNALNSEPTLKSLVKKLSASQSRLLTTSGDDENATVSLAHEALLTAWPELEGWIESNRKGLLDRAEVMRACQKWEDADRHDSLLLPGGLILDSAVHLRKEFPHLIEGNLALIEFVHLSQKRDKRNKLLRRVGIAAAVVAVSGFLIYFNHQAVQEQRLENERELALERLESEVLSSRLAGLMKNGDPVGALALAASDTEASLGSFGPRSAAVEALASVSRHLSQILEIPEESRFEASEQALASGVVSLAWRSDGQGLVAGTRGGTLFFRDLAENRWSSEVVPDDEKGLGSAVKAVRWLDSEGLVAVYGDGSIGRIRDGFEASFEKKTSPVAFGSIATDGGVAVSPQAENGVQWFSHGEWKTEPLSQRVTALAVGESGRLVLAVEQGPEGNAEIQFRSAEIGWKQGSAGRRVAALDLQANQQLLAAAAIGLGVEIFSMVDGEQVGFLPCEDPVTAIDFHPEESWLAATTSAGELLLWKLEKQVDNFGAVDYSQRTPSQVMEAHRETALSLSWSPSGDQIATGSDDGTVRLWDLELEHQNFLRLSLSEGAGIRGVAFSRDGKWLAGGGEDGTVSVWDLDDRKLVGPPLSLSRAPVQCLAWHPVEMRLAAGAVRGALRISAWPEGEWGGSSATHEDTVWKLRWDAKGDRLFSSSWDRTVGVWSPSGEPLMSWQGHEDYVQGLAVSPDGTRVATGGTDGRIWWWDAAKGEVLSTWKGHGPGSRVAVCALDFRPDGERIASASNDGRVILWDVESGKEVKVFEGHEGDVETLAFDPSGRWLASAGDDGTIWIWDCENLAPFLSFRAHGKSIANLCWKPGEERIVVSASSDGTVFFLPCSPDTWAERLGIFETTEASSFQPNPNEKP
ncbi:MAG: hypothetical protein P1U85_14165 [Verrucomicrobiales bacterium]|nr:hypothetical protein [Verrucomicrobiales bacterium]